MGAVCLRTMRNKSKSHNISQTHTHTHTHTHILSSKAYDIHYVGPGMWVVVPLEGNLKPKSDWTQLLKSSFPTKESSSLKLSK